MSTERTPLSDDDINQARRQLRNYLRMITEAQIKQATDVEPSTPSLTPAEAAGFLKEAANDRWFALFVLALATGLRPSEYFGLKWSDVDLERGLVTVQRSLIWRSYKSGDWYFGEPKTPRSRLSG